MHNRKIDRLFRTLLTLFGVLILAASTGSAEEYPKLRESIDPVLQSRLERLVRAQGLQRAVKKERLALALADISDPRQPRVAAINGDVMQYAASLPKIAILLAAFVQIEQGKLALDKTLEADMVQMIRHSGNKAATRVLELVGRKELLRILESPRFALYDRRFDGGLWVGKAYAKRGAYRRDPLHNISHGATAMQVARFYYLLDTNRLVGPALTPKMKEILSEPAINHKFVKGLANWQQIKLYRKSGTWKQFHADSVLVEYGSHRVVMVGLVRDPRGGQWLDQIATPMLYLVVDEGAR